MEITCNNCDWQGIEDDLTLVEFDVKDEAEKPTATENPTGRVSRLITEPKERDFLKGCPNCLTDNYLMNLE